jgi:hypothetical protein
VDTVGQTPAIEVDFFNCMHFSGQLQTDAIVVEEHPSKHQTGDRCLNSI